ncbi:MAG TPA: DUF5670 family protein [Pyrinomonadaceae bacterium]|nr:DUF5670 family protein [Pyrinomonadaceae bacterium]
MLKYVALAIFAAWLVATVFFGKGGLIHILLLNALAVALIQFVADRRAARQ